MALLLSFRKWRDLSQALNGAYNSYWSQGSAMTSRWKVLYFTGEPTVKRHLASIGAIRTQIPYLYKGTIEPIVRNTHAQIPNKVTIGSLVAVILN